MRRISSKSAPVKSGGRSKVVHVSKNPKHSSRDMESYAVAKPRMTYCARPK